MRKFANVWKRLIYRKPLQSRQEKWGRSWAKPNFAPEWRAHGIPEMLRKAVESGWLPAGSSLLDIGCGAGETAAWLAERGYRVTGIDFAPSAIARATAACQHENLQFRVEDICRDTETDATFDCLFDRGCLHGLPDGCMSPYVANVAQYVETGGKFLLMHKTIPAANRGATIVEERDLVDKKVRAYLEQAFTIERTQIIDMLTGADPDTETIHPGLAFWLVRN